MKINKRDTARRKLLSILPRVVALEGLYTNERPWNADKAFLIENILANWDGWDVMEEVKKIFDLANRND